MKIEVSIDLLKDFFASGTTCRHCKYRGTNCIGKSCNDSQIESLIEKSQLILDFDLAILELEKLKKKCTEEQTVGLLFAIEKLEEIKKEFKQ
jgi:copper chaperone CopZ